MSWLPWFVSMMVVLALCAVVGAAWLLTQDRIVAQWERLERWMR